MIPVCVGLATPRAPVLAQIPNTQTSLEDQPLDPDKPLTNIPDFGVAWPDLNDTPVLTAPKPEEPREDSAQDAQTDAETSSDDEVQAQLLENEAVARLEHVLVFVLHLLLNDRLVRHLLPP